MAPVTDSRPDPLVALARLAAEARVLGGHELEELPPDLPEAIRNARAGCFVSLHSPGGALRGCLGTLAPTEVNLAWEVVRNAGAAATRDRRFAPVIPTELAGLKVKVDVLSPPEPIPGPDHLDPKRFGVIVSDGLGRRGVLLPDLEGISTVAEQLAIARRKAGIPEGAPLQLQRFTVTRHQDSR